ncbi:MAG: disulfide bond formation protein B [Geminicoccaceae bacterium]
MGRGTLKLAVLFAAGALAFAYFLQYAVGIEPCNLCWWQRYPYMAIIPVGIIALLSGRIGLGLAVILLLFLADAGVAWYHGGVEAGIFALPEGCNSRLGATTVEELRAQLLNAAPACDQVAASFLGLSLSVWNAIGASLMAIIVAVGLLRSRRAG